MSKENEALEKICNQACKDRDELFYLNHKNCKQSKENEKHFPYCDGCLYCSGNENYKIIEQALNEGGKAKEILEIIKKKNVQLRQFKDCLLYNETDEQALADYNKHFGYDDDGYHSNELTQTEFNLIKEWLEK